MKNRNTFRARGGAAKRREAEKRTAPDSCMRSPWPLGLGVFLLLSSWCLLEVIAVSSGAFAMGGRPSDATGEAAVSPLTVAPSGSVEDDYRRAKALYESQHYAESRQLFASILDRDPTNPWAALYLELIDERLGEGTAAAAATPSARYTAPRASAAAVGPSAAPSEAVDREREARQQKVQELLDQLESAKRVKAHAKVIKTAQRLLMLEPGHAKAQRYLSDAEQALADVRESQADEALSRARAVAEEEAARRAKERRTQTETATQGLSHMRIASLIDEAKELEQSRRYSEAIELYEMALAIDPYDHTLVEQRDALRVRELQEEAARLRREEAVSDEQLLLDVEKTKQLPSNPYGISPALPSLYDESMAPRRDLSAWLGPALTQPVSLNLEKVSLVDLSRFLSEMTGVNIIPSSAVVQEARTTNLRVQDMPLYDVIKYVTKTQQLTYRFEDDAIWLATKAEAAQEQVETRVYRLSQGNGMVAKFEEGDASSESLGGGDKVGEILTVRDVLTDIVPTVNGSKLVLDERSGALIVTNTPSNLQLVERVLEAIDVAPSQVVIEARFVEVRVDDLSELGIDWQLDSPWKIEKKNGMARTQIAGGSGVNFTDFSRQAEGFNLTYQGILTRPQFSAVLHALEETGKIKTLSAPKITTLNNQQATIKVVDGYVYPSRYEVSVVQEDLNGDGDTNDVVATVNEATLGRDVNGDGDATDVLTNVKETRFVNLPQGFQTRDLGILLRVTPSVGKGREVIHLALVPEISELQSIDEFAGQVFVPRFASRNLSTNVVIQDGETVVLGGLIRETLSETETSVPVLGDLPVVGGMFRKKSESTVKRNLLIFVSARVLSGGQEIVNAPFQAPTGAKVSFDASAGAPFDSSAEEL